MVTITLLCPYCESEKLVRNGHAPNGKQRYFCQECKRHSRENPSSRGYSEERKEEILRAYQERSSLRGLERTFGVSRYTVAKWVKKSSGTASLEGNASSARCKEPRSNNIGTR
jgi:transposase-like protein